MSDKQMGRQIQKKTERESRERKREGKRDESKRWADSVIKRRIKQKGR